ncbi:MAG: cytochrome P450 [Acidimicrobiia bacterium]|nr:cytochrome P450 [Acidimicrobiia bacterium]
MTERVPVADWATDFDHTDPAYNQRVHEIWDDLRERCPVAHTDRFGGTWLPTRHEDISAIAYDTEHYTSQGVVVSPNRPDEPPPLGPAPPITSDPPVHGEARKLLLPPFSPKVIANWEDTTRQLCRDLIEALPVTDGVVDAAQHYTQHIPVKVIAAMLGVPETDGDLFRHFISMILENPGSAADLPEEETLEYYLNERILEHRDEPQDDLISYLLGVEFAGEPLSERHIVGTVLLLLIAGIDTTWSAIGSSLWHLATHPDDRQRLVDEPELISTAVEEFLRAYAPVTMARLVAEDHDLHGCPVKAGEWMLLPFPAANRDPEFFERADEVIIDRAKNRHAAFGLGIHRCLGSNLARLELRVALEEWLAAIPEFSLADGTEVRWSTGQIRGPRELPFHLGP